MMRETFLDKTISQKLRAEYEADKEMRLTTHASVGLTASILGYPLQWQVLKVLGQGTAVHDDYTIRKFLRGKTVEDWLVGYIPGLVATQEEVEYRGVLGHVDCVVSTEGQDYDFNVGRLPHEVKSVTNAKFKRLVATGEADLNHQLQAGLYALALGSKYYAIDYVASDDLRILSMVYQTEDIQPQIDKIITDFEKQIAKKKIPVFEPRFKWQAQKQYQAYPEWQNLTFDECQERQKVQMPDAWQRFTSKK